MSCARKLLLPCHLFFAAGGMSFLLAVQPARAQTDFLREFAKNKPRVLIVTSGPEARPYAETFQQSLLRNGDFRNRKPDEARLVSPEEADALLSGGTKDWGRCSLVFFLTGKDGREASALSPRLSALLPLDAALLGGRESVVQAAKDVDRPGEPTYRVALYAPDAPRLARVSERLMNRRVGNFRELPFREQYTTNRLAVFSTPEQKSLLEDWGKLSAPNTWNEVTWFPLSARSSLTPEQLAERTEVYFVDRSSPDAARLPEAVQKGLSGVTVRPTSVVVARREGNSDENTVVVVSAPSRLLLETRIARRKTVESLKQEIPVFEAVNLGGVGATSLLIVGGGSNANSDLINSLHAEVSGAMRQMGVSVEPRGPVLAKLEGDLALQMAQGATDTKGILRRRYPTRYVWAFTLTDLSGATTYRAGEKKITPDLPRFDASEPTRPTRNRDEEEDRYQRRVRDWRDRWSQWDRSRREYNDHFRTDACEWELAVTREYTAHVGGRLQLIDTKAPNGPAFIWEQECRAEDTQTGEYRTQHATVRGHDNRPNSLETPTATDRCPSSLLLAVARKASEKGLAALREEAILPTGNALVIPASVTETPLPVLPVKRAISRAKVAEVDGETLSLNIGATQGVHIGDRYEILLQAKDTIDPDTGRILRTRVLSSFFVVVTHVDAEVCDVRAATPQDRAKWGQVKVGVAVRRTEP